jgi:hypothetical protein
MPRAPFFFALTLLACNVDDPEPKVARDDGDAGVWLDGTLALNTWTLCPLLGPSTDREAVFGTDLGFSVWPDDNERMPILFGDTFAEAAEVCAFPISPSDDLQATLPAERPRALKPGIPSDDAASACDALEYEVAENSDPPHFSPLRLFPDASTREADAVLDTGPFRTPAAAFSDGERTFTIFTRGDLTKCETADDCPSGTECSADPSYTRAPVGLCSPVLEGTLPPVCDGDEDCGPLTSCEVTGLCVATRPHRGEGEDEYEVEPHHGVLQTLYVASNAFDEKPDDFAIGAHFPSNRFVNAAARGVAHFDPDDPSQNDYRPGGHTLLVWGRRAFFGTHGYAALPYLLYQPLEDLVDDEGNIAWSPRFFAGLDEDGKPTWSELEADAQPIYGLDDGESEFDLVSHMTLSWVEPLERWVMLYGGSLPAWLITDPESGEPWPKSVEQPEPGAIHARLGRHPWSEPQAEGAWSEPFPVLSRERAAEYLACDPGAPEALPGCSAERDSNRPLERLLAAADFDAVLDDPGAVTSACLSGETLITAQYELSGDAGGHLYGVNILDAWTQSVDKGSKRAAEIYWNVSAWNPYQVALIKTRLVLDDE